MKKYSFILLFTLMLFGCSSTSIVSSWKPVDSAPIKMKKVLVVGLMGNKERELRESTERAVAQILIDNGINAIPAIKALGVPPKDSKENKEMIDNELKQNNYDGIMIISLVNKDREVDVNTPGYYSGWWYGPYWGWANGWYRYAPAYISVSTKYCVEANLYSVEPKKLLYSALTKSYDPENATDLARKFALAIMKDMYKEGLIVNQVKK